jgi:hypothetical protein
MRVKRMPVPICSALHCQSATSRVFDDKGVFPKVSNVVSRRHRVIEPSREQAELEQAQDG